MDKRLLFHCPQAMTIARQMAELDGRIELGVVDWKRFPDAWPNIMIRGFDDLRNRDVAYLASLDSPETVFEQWSVMLAIAEARPKSFRLLLPYFPTGTMERIDMEGQVATASTLARLLSALPPSGPGPIPLYMWDVHALPIRHYFGANIAPRFKTGTKVLKARLEQEGDVTVAFPDEGAWKRFKVLFSDDQGKPLFPFVICRKQRHGDKRIVTVIEGDPAGKNVVIVDDLVHSGGTTIECMHAMKAAGAVKVSAFATHGVMEKDAWKRFLNAGFYRVWITDSCPVTAGLVKDQPPFEVLSLVKSMINAVMDG
jgi:ribose-phosphate pyrophosphokinase